MIHLLEIGRRHNRSEFRDILGIAAGGKRNLTLYR